MALVEVRNVHKSFQRDSQVIEVFENLTLDVAAGGFTALMGPSGSGKSTFLNLLAGLDRPTSGTMTGAGAAEHTMSPAALAQWGARAVCVGVYHANTITRRPPPSSNSERQLLVSLSR